MSQLIQVIIEQDISHIPGRLNVVSVSRVGAWGRFWIKIKQAFNTSEPVLDTRFRSGLSVGVRLTTANYAKLMGMTAVAAPAHDQGFATMDMIPMPNPTQSVGDPGVSV